MAGISDFEYVEFASNGLTYFRNVVGHVKHLPWLQDRYAYTDSFSTYFLLDRRFMEYVNRNNQSGAGYTGPCYAHFLPLDIDSPHPSLALQTAREITPYLLNRLGAPDEAIVPYYSGIKGFHLCLSTDVFGDVRPGEELPGVFRELRRSIVKEAKVHHPETVDFSTSDRLRLLRLPNIRHSKSGLYKIPLSIDEVLQCETREIRRIARELRRVRLTHETGLMPRSTVEPVPTAVELYQRRGGQAEPPGVWLYFGGKGVKKVTPPSRRLSRGRPALDWGQDAPPHSRQDAGGTKEILADPGQPLCTPGTASGRRRRGALAEGGTRIPAPQTQPHPPPKNP